MRSLARRLLPATVRRQLGTFVRDLPHRFRDAPADLRGWFLSSPERLPPARLRRRVGLTSARLEWLQVGERVAADVLGAFHRVRPTDGAYGKWLDFGCGSGRILPHLIAAGIDDLWGVDVDRDAIRWLQRRRDRERFLESPRMPPLPFPDAMFDAVLAVSVFSHLDEAEQRAWLAEMSRILRPGGWLIASTHGPDLVVTRGDLAPEQLERLRTSGFLFAPGGGPFNEDSAFHAAEYLTQTWGAWFDCRVSLPRGLGGYQDVSVWQNR